MPGGTQTSGSKGQQRQHGIKEYDRWGAPVTALKFASLPYTRNQD